ncbi:CvfB family protein [Fusibacter bizertensis]
MFAIGKIQKAYVNRFSDFGPFLSHEKNGDFEVLLPNKFAPKDLELDSELTVFIYRDSEQRLTATTQIPLLSLGEIGYLEVVSSIKSGYFLNMGLDKDLYMPYNETKGKPQKGRKVLVIVYLDNQDQLSASMKIFNHLQDANHLKIGEHVKGTVYEIKPEMGAFVAVDDKYHGMIPKHELYKEIKEGAKIEARITKVRDDGKVNLSVKEKSAVQINDDIEIVMKALTDAAGVLYLNDESEPDDIKRKLNISKRAYKRAIGRLLKENKIQIFEDGIRLID